MKGVVINYFVSTLVVKNYPLTYLNGRISQIMCGIKVEISVHSREGRTRLFCYSTKAYCVWIWSYGVVAGHASKSIDTSAISALCVLSSAASQG